MEHTNYLAKTVSAMTIEVTYDHNIYNFLVQRLGSHNDITETISVWASHFEENYVEWDWEDTSLQLEIEDWVENELEELGYNKEETYEDSPKPSNGIKTNEQCLRELLRDISNQHSFYAAILRERIQKIAELTRQDIKENPTRYDNSIFSHNWYIAVCEIINKHLNDDKNGNA